MMYVYYGYSMWRKENKRVAEQSRTWAEIYLERAVHNLNEIKRHTNCEVIAVVKADAYGHGAVEMARLYEKCGVAYLAVACVQEGVELRENGISAPILVLGTTACENVEKALSLDLTLTIYSLESAQMISRIAQKCGANAKIHVKIDTGMSRLGFRFDAFEDVKAAVSLPNMEVEGIFMHFADADNADQSFTDLQFKRFETMVSEMKQRGVAFKICHCANSAAVLNYKKAWLTHVRAGIILYGLSGGIDAIDLQPVMELKTRICDIHAIFPGDTVSYGRTHTANETAKIAVIPAGYADGVKRSLSGCGQVLLNQTFVPICGRVCMDMTMLDVTNVPDVKIGDVVTIFGMDASADLLAKQADTISYELICGVSKRVPRIYLEK